MRALLDQRDGTCLKLEEAARITASLNALSMSISTFVAGNINFLKGALALFSSELKRSNRRMYKLSATAN